MIIAITAASQREPAYVVGESNCCAAGQRPQPNSLRSSGKEPIDGCVGICVVDFQGHRLKRPLGVTGLFCRLLACPSAND